MFTYTPKQKEALRLIRSKKYSEIYLYGGSRSAKTFTLLSEIIVRALTVPKTSHCVCRYEQVDCRKTVFEQTLDLINDKMFDSKLLGKNSLDKSGLAYKTIGNTQLRFHNGSYVAFLGVNGNANLEKVLGSEWSTIFINEASEISSSAYYTLRTRLAENKGLDIKMFLDANPPPKRHWLYRRFHLKQNLETGKPLVDDTDFAILKMNPVDNIGNIPKKYYEKMSSQDQTKAYRDRFFLGEYADILDGAVFKEELSRLDEEGRETAITLPESAPVVAILDVGQTTSCWIVHINAEENRIEMIDYIEGRGVGVKWMLDKIRDSEYNLKTVVLPHDARAANHQTGSSVEEEYRAYQNAYGYETTVLPKNKWGDNINALRKWFPRFWFNSEKTSMGMDAIRNYEYTASGGAADEMSTVKPKHNWASHGADALKYVALYCGRDLEYILETTLSRKEKQKEEKMIRRRKEEDRWIVENMLQEWRDINADRYDIY